MDRGSRFVCRLGWLRVAHHGTRPRLKPKPKFAGYHALRRITVGSSALPISVLGLGWNLGLNLHDATPSVTSELAILVLGL
ncbi:hypothetical protein chiPu_0024299, partial [Chiloscyllium punctatum]|nr:hypothetical protein [Chiloscyllium punctatum]